MPSKLRRRSWIVLLVVLMSQVALSPPAHAVSCGAGKHIFIRQESTSLRWGARGKISVPNLTLDP